MSPRHARAPFAALLLAAISLVCFCPPAAHAQGPRYTVRDLGAFEPRGVNDAGQVVGSATVNGRGFAVLYDGTLKTINPPGSVAAEAWGINSRGQVAGTALICGEVVNGECRDAGSRAFVYHRGRFTLLGTLGGISSFGLDIDEGGRAVGYSYTPGLSPDAQAFASDGGPLENLGAKMGVGGSVAGGVNAVGQITGRFGDRNGSGGFLYDTRDGTFSLFQLSGFPRDLNDHGQIVGGLSGNDDGSGRAFLYAGGTVKDLGTLLPSHTFSTAWAVNNAGQIVGVSSVSWFTRVDEHAFIYEGGVMRDLNLLIAPNSGWVLHEATDINGHGQIVGTGKLNGQPRAFMLTPAEPVLLAEPDSSRALALDSVTFERDPFSLSNRHNFSADSRTRITLVARNVELSGGEGAQQLAARAEDAQGGTHPLAVEHVGIVPGFPALAQITVRLPDSLAAGGDFQLSVTLRSRTSNKVTVRIKPPPPASAR